jgi:hypothetical protein
MEIYKFIDWSRCSKQYNIYVLFFKYLVHFNLLSIQIIRVSGSFPVPSGRLGLGRWVHGTGSAGPEAIGPGLHCLWD